MENNTFFHFCIRVKNNRRIFHLSCASLPDKCCAITTFCLLVFRFGSEFECSCTFSAYFFLCFFSVLFLHYTGGFSPDDSLCSFFPVECMDINLTAYSVGVLYILYYLSSRRLQHLTGTYFFYSLPFVGMTYCSHQFLNWCAATGHRTVAFILFGSFSIPNKKGGTSLLFIWCG